MHLCKLRMMRMALTELPEQILLLGIGCLLEAGFLAAVGTRTGLLRQPQVMENLLARLGRLHPQQVQLEPLRTDQARVRQGLSLQAEEVAVASHLETVLQTVAPEERDRECGEDQVNCRVARRDHLEEAEAQEMQPGPMFTSEVPEVEVVLRASRMLRVPVDMEGRMEPVEVAEVPPSMAIIQAQEEQAEMVLLL